MFSRTFDMIRGTSQSDDRGLMEVIATLDRATADQAAGILIDHSISFAVDPLPNDRWAILVKEAAAGRVRTMLIGGEPTRTSPTSLATTG